MGGVVARDIRHPVVGLISCRGKRTATRAVNAPCPPSSCRPQSLPTALIVATLPWGHADTGRGLHGLVRLYPSLRSCLNWAASEAFAQAGWAHKHALPVAAHAYVLRSEVVSGCIIVAGLASTDCDTPSGVVGDGGGGGRQDGRGEHREVGDGVRFEASGVTAGPLPDGCAEASRRGDRGGKWEMSSPKSRVDCRQEPCGLPIDLACSPCSSLLPSRQHLLLLHHRRRRPRSTINNTDSVHGIPKALAKAIEYRSPSDVASKSVARQDAAPRTSNLALARLAFAPTAKMAAKMTSIPKGLG